MFEWIENHPELKKVDVCVANAGFSSPGNLMEGNPTEWKAMMDVNVVGLNHCVQLAVKSMLKNKIDDGQIVMVNSMSGHRLVPQSKFRFYSATKFAVTALCEGWRLELGQMEPKNNIRVSQVSPGVVRTEFQQVCQAMDMMKWAPNPLTSEDLADMIKYIIQAPKHVHILDMKILPTEQRS